MAYPNRLLPQQNFKIIEWDEVFRNCFLIHFTDTKDNRDPLTKKLKNALVVKQTDHLRDYSNNLLGVFIIDDIYWGAIESAKAKYFNAEWKKGSNVDTPQVPNEFTRFEERGYFFLKIGDVHEKVITFEDSTQAKPICMLIHTPTNSNFWHFSLRWFFEGKDLEKWTDAIKRRMKTSAKTLIIESAKFEEPAFQAINQNHYIDA